MRCNFCGAEWTLPYKLNIEECPFCRSPLAKPVNKTRVNVQAHQPANTTKREDFDIVGTVLRAYKGTNPVVYVPEGITELGMVKPDTGAFFENKVIQKVVLPKSLRKMSPKAFASSTVREVVFSEGITSISDHAFEYSWLRHVTLPSTVKEIGDSAFHRCRNLTTINLPDALIRIGNTAFEECTNLRSVNLPESLNSIGRLAFMHTGLESITVPGSITEIPYKCFSHCTQLRFVDLQKGIKVIGPSSFAECTALTEVILPDGTEKLCHGAFMNCHYLNRVVIPNSVAEISKYRYCSYSTVYHGVFENCTALIDVVWPSSRFDKSIFLKSLFYDQLITKEKAFEEQQEAIAKAEEIMRKHNKQMVDDGICPKCGGKISFWTYRCKICGTKY